MSILYAPFVPIRRVSKKVTRNQIKNARISEQIGQLQIRDLELTLDNSLINTYDQYNLRMSLMDIAGENLETSELNLDLGEERYRNGSINSLQRVLEFYEEYC